MLDGRVQDTSSLSGHLRAISSFLRKLVLAIERHFRE